MARPAPACCSFLASADPPKARSSPDASPPRSTWQLLGQGLELELAAAVRAARREGRFELPVDKPGACHAVAVATVGLPPLRLPALPVPPFGCPLENGRLALPERAARRASRSSSATRAIRSARRRLTSGQAVVQLPSSAVLPREAGEADADLSDQLLVGVGSPPEDVARRNSQHTSGSAQVVDPHPSTQRVGRLESSKHEKVVRRHEIHRNFAVLPFLPISRVGSISLRQRGKPLRQQLESPPRRQRLGVESTLSPEMAALVHPMVPWASFPSPSAFANKARYLASGAASRHIVTSPRSSRSRVT